MWIVKNVYKEDSCCFAEKTDETNVVTAVVVESQGSRSHSVYANELKVMSRRNFVKSRCG